MEIITIEELQSKLDQANKIIESQQKQIADLEERYKTLEGLYTKKENIQHNKRGAGRKKKLTPELIMQIHKLKSEQYMTIQQIAEELNISVGLVHKGLHI